MLLWSCFNRSRIFDVLELAKSESSLVTLWQSHARQNQLLGKIGSVTRDEIIIDLETSPVTPLSANEPLLVHCELEEILFKKEKFKTNPGEIVFDMPSEVKLKDYRKTDRYCYKYQDFKFISFKTKAAKESENFQTLSSILVDISTEGLSFVIDYDNKRQLSVGESLFVKKITDQKLPNLHEAEIIYISPYEIQRNKTSEKTNLYKVGVKFIEPLNSISYRSISNIVTRKQSRMNGLNVSTFNGLDENEQERKLKKISRDNPVQANQLRERIENLDRLRYLTAQMKQNFLLDVNHDLLAAALRLSSKELIYELLYEISENLRMEFLEKLSIPKPPSAIIKAQDEICKVIVEKEKKGELVLDPTAFEKYV